jgi:hypothetical protein
MIIEGASVVEQIKPSKDPNSWAVIRENVDGLSPEAIKNWKVRDYEHRFDVILQGKGRSILQTILSNIRVYGVSLPNTKQGEERKKLIASGEQRLFELPEPKKREYKTNEILHTFSYSGNGEVTGLKEFLKANLTQLVEGVLKGLNIEGVPPLKLVYVEDPEPAFELRVK